MVESSTAGAGGTGWYKGMVKAVSSGDCLVITLFSSTKTGPPTEKTITLSSLIAPRLARGGGVDEPFAWDSREYLRKMCVGKEVAFRVDYTLPSIGREFGSVFLGDKNVAALIVSQGWAKVREQGPQKGEVSPYLAELVRLQDQAKQQGLGCWSKVPGAAETSIRNLPPSAIGDPNNLDATGLLAANKGRSMQGIVEQVQDGSTVQAKITERFPHIYAKEAAFAENSQRSSGCCNPVKQLGPISLEHVLLALRESKEERDLRTRGLFNFFDAANLGYLDYAQIEAGLLALHVPAEYKYAKDLLKVCDANRDGRVDYHEFRRYMDDKELELYRIFQAIDVEHNGCILPEELWDALVRAGIEIDDEELARFVEHVDKDNNGIITFEEWRDFLLFYPHEATIENIYHHWERVCLVDIGEQAVIPEGISKYVHPFRYFIAGGIAGATSRTATAPLDRLKVALQVQTTQAWIMPAIKKIWKEDGLLGFFRGNGLNVVKVAPESAIKFYTYEMLKNIIASGNEDKGDIGTVGRLFAGGLAGAVAQTTIYPLDLLKTRLQTFSCEGDKVPKLGKLTKDIWVHEGPRVFYKGLVPSLLGIIPYAGIDLAAYETLKDVSKNYILQDTDPGPLIQLACGTVSGALGATCVYPLQVIRTRMQAQTSNKGAAYQGMSDVFWQTLKHEGYGGFYKGLLPNLLKVVPAASITYLVYERMKKWLELD